MSEIIENTEETIETEEKGLLYAKFIDVIGNKENIRIEEYAADLLGPTDKDNVTPIILSEKNENLEENSEDLRNIMLNDVHFIDHGVVKSEPIKMGWMDFLYNDGKIIKN